MANITKLGYTAPTPIQTIAIPAALEGRDLMGLAQTGTGKTAAFLLPIITQLLKRPEAQRRTGRKARVLVLAPTRELAEQIHESALDLARNTGLRSTTVYGGVNMNRQITALRNGADIIVACPGRLLDHMGQRTVDLTGIEHLVLDEADQMFDMGFFPDIKKVLAGLPKERQTMLFSATMPEAIRSLAAEILKDPETLRVNHNAPTETVSHAIYPVAHHLKTKLLIEILQRNREGSVLVFTRTKHRAKRLAENLEKMGHKSTALQGNLSQNRRKEAMDGFRSGRFRVLVATDIAARGIDVNLVTHVVNFDVPSTPETYTHRIGRTGRAERTGEAHTFVTGEDVSMVRAIERLMREPLTRKKIEGFDYNEGPSAADKDFNRPIMDRRGGGRSGGHSGGGYGRSFGGGYGGGNGGGYGDRSRGERSGQDRSDAGRSDSGRSDAGRSDSARSGFGRSDAGRPVYERAASERTGERTGERSGERSFGRRDDRRPEGRDDRRPGARDDRGGYGQRPAYGARRPAYGALRSENSDGYNADGRPAQPGDDIYATDRRDEREQRGWHGRPRGNSQRPAERSAERSAQPRQGAPRQAQGARPQGDSRPRDGERANTHHTAR
jgi:ATP-dependent RNA helicase RhlE